jgi:hypothetical protein
MSAAGTMLFADEAMASSKYSRGQEGRAELIKDEYLRGCKRIVALLGAGISASSGLPTFRGAGGLWLQ